MANDRLQLLVDGEPVEASSGEPVLHLLRRIGRRVPTLCHHEELSPSGFCGLCVVLDHGSGTLLRACATVATGGMQLDTRGPQVVSARRRRLAELLAGHPLDCCDCARGGDCRLQELLFEIGLEGDTARPPLPRVPARRVTELIVLEPGRCLGCGRCVRLCAEVQGVFEYPAEAGTPVQALARFHSFDHDCEHCGLCVRSCPVGALVTRSGPEPVPVWHRSSTGTTCSMCSCGCQVEVLGHDGTVEVATAAGLPPNRASLCARGWLSWDVLTSPERLTAPLVRRHGQLVQASWEDALDAVATALGAARASGTPVAAVGSTRLTTEDAYLLQRLFRAGLGSPHLGCGPEGGVAALVEGMGAMCAAPRSTAGYQDLAAADVVLVVRGDPGRTHPLVRTEVLRAASRPGRRLTLAHALSGPLGRHAHRMLRLAPGSEEALLDGVARVIAARSTRGGLDAPPGFSAWRRSLEQLTAPAVAAATGLEPDEVEELAAELAAARHVVIVVVTGTGIPGSEAGVARAAVSLHSLLAARGGVLVLGEKANTQGVVDAGLHPDLLPGHAAAADATARHALSRRWGTADFGGPGWPVAELAARAAARELGVLYLVGSDPVASWPGALNASAAVAGAGFVVVHDAFLSATARRADVVLPVAILGERNGTAVSADGIRRPLRQVVPPPAGVPQDGRLLLEVARRLEVALPHGPDLEREIADLTGKRGPSPLLRRLLPAARPEPAAAAGMLLDSAPQLLHSGAVTRRSDRLARLSPPVVARLNPADAREVGLATGEVAAIAAHGRELLFRVLVDRSVRPGTVVVPWHGSPDGAAALAESTEATTTAVIRRQA